jgi:hypothetical protein
MVKESVTSKGNAPMWLYRIATTLLFATFIADLILCPHSKVEESFQLQATHDLFYHGIGPVYRSTLILDAFDTKNQTLPYDHLQYPGGKFITRKLLMMSSSLILQH